MVTIDSNSLGKLYVKSQVTDYMLCGDALTDMNVVELFINTYEEDQHRTTSPTTNQDPNNSDDDSDHLQRPGRPRNKHIEYLPHHLKHKQKQ
jgi:hypothetical protein